MALAGRLTADMADLAMTVLVADHTVATIATVYRPSILLSSQVLINSSTDHVSGGSSSRGAGSSSFSDNRRGYEEYNAGDDEVTNSSPTRVTSGRNVVRKSSVPTTKRTPAPERSEPLVDLLGGFDDDTFGAPAPSPGANKELPSVGIDGMFRFPKSTKNWELIHLVILLSDDDFTDFQAAPVQAPATSVAAAPQPTLPTTGGKKPNLMDMLNTTSVQTPVQVGYGQPQQPAGYGGMGMSMGGGSMGMGMGSMNQFSSSPMPAQLQPQQSNLFGSGSAPMRPSTTIMGGSQSSMSNSSVKPSAAATQTKSANFDDLWSMSLGGGGGGGSGGGLSSSVKSGTTTAGKSIKDLEKEKAQAGIWGAQQKSNVGGVPVPAAFGGGFGNAAPPSSGGDDLLL